jgi:hypothetical protein
MPSSTPCVLLRDANLPRQREPCSLKVAALIYESYTCGTVLRRRSWYSAKSAKIGSAPSSPLACTTRVTAQLVAPSIRSAKSSSAPSSPLASTEPAQAFPALPAPAAASRKRWFTGAPFMSNKAAALRAKQHNEKLKVATPTAWFSSRSWDVGRSASASKVPQLQQVSQPLAQQEQRPIFNNTMAGCRRGWRPVSRSSSPHHQAQGVRSFDEVEDTAGTRSDNDHENDTSEFATPVPDAVRNRDAAWPPASKVSRH